MSTSHKIRFKAALGKPSLTFQYRSFPVSKRTVFHCTFYKWFFSNSFHCLLSLFAFCFFVLLRSYSFFTVAKETMEPVATCEDVYKGRQDWFLTALLSNFAEEQKRKTNALSWWLIEIGLLTRYWYLNHFARYVSINGELAARVFAAPFSCTWQKLNCGQHQSSGIAEQLTNQSEVP